MPSLCFGLTSNLEIPPPSLAEILPQVCLQAKEKHTVIATWPGMFSSDIIITKIKIGIHCFQRPHKNFPQVINENLIFLCSLILTLILYNRGLV